MGAAFSLILLVLGTACAGGLAWLVRAATGTVPPRAPRRA
jgi:hypothetical protein